jgi:hypothetical protein
LFSSYSYLESLLRRGNIGLPNKIFHVMEKVAEILLSRSQKFAFSLLKRNKENTS